MSWILSSITYETVKSQREKKQKGIILEHFLFIFKFLKGFIVQKWGDPKLGWPKKFYFTWYKHDIIWNMSLTHEI